ncbi:MAG: multicopper oxidase domain-containing protein [Paracoccaceae bacterium]
MKAIQTMLTTRRSVLVGGTAVAVGGLSVGFGLNAQTAPSFVVPLPLPRLIDLTSGGDVFDLAIQEGRSKIVPWAETATYGYSGALLGPVVRVRSGQSVTARIANKLSVESSVHWHGLFVPSDVDGPFNPIAAGDAWSPTLKINQPACTTWFHPHPHGDTARQTYMGLAGLLYVDDGSAEAFNLPRDYGIDDIPVILQDRNFGKDGQLIYDRSPMAMMHGSRGANVVVNGAVRPVSRPPAGLVRLRLLDGANARNFKLAFSDDRIFHVIANDAGWLSEPVPLKEIEIAPGERYEILVDLSDGRPVDLLTWPDHNGRFGDGLTDRAKEFLARMRERREAVLRFEPTPAGDRRKREVPKRLQDPGRPERAKSVRRRTFSLDSMMMANMPAMRAVGSKPSAGHGGHGTPQAGGMPSSVSGMRMGINGQTYEMSRIDAEVALGTQEVWEIISAEMAHPFHIHGATFQTLTKGGKPVPAHEAGIKDTLLVESKAELLVSFRQQSTREKPFVFHCHILEHEELGMMATYLSQPSA